MNFWLTRQKYSENLRILVAYLCNFRLSRRWNLPDLWKWLSMHRAQIGAHEIVGNKLVLPERFHSEVAELSVTSPYTEPPLPSGYAQHYFPGY
jgi:hypothetical protein